MRLPGQEALVTKPTTATNLAARVTKRPVKTSLKIQDPRAELRPDSWQLGPVKASWILAGLLNLEVSFLTLDPVIWRKLLVPALSASPRVAKSCYSENEMPLPGVSQQVGLELDHLQEN